MGSSDEPKKERGRSIHPISASAEASDAILDNDLDNNEDLKLGKNMISVPGLDVRTSKIRTCQETFCVVSKIFFSAVDFLRDDVITQRDRLPKDICSILQQMNHDKRASVGKIR